eukprot:6059061-Prymnesium_polylepis.1
MAALLAATAFLHPAAPPALFHIATPPARRPARRRARRPLASGSDEEWEVGGVDVAEFLAGDGWLDAHFTEEEWGVMDADDELEQDAEGMALEIAEATAQHDALARGAASDGTPLPLVIIAADLAASVRQDGVGCSPDALSESTAAALRAFLLAQVERGDDPDATSQVLSERAAADAPQSRWDLRLPMAPEVEAALRELLAAGSPLANALDQLAGGADAELYELGGFVSLPGAAPQLLHADTLFSDTPCLYTATVALQDVTPAHGPTLFVPGSHVAEAHVAFDDDADAFVSDATAALACVRTGGAVLYDSRCLHCGGANRADQPRALFYVTFRHPEADARALGNEAAHTMRAELRGRYRLGELVR